MIAGASALVQPQTGLSFDTTETIEPDQMKVDPPLPSPTSDVLLVRGPPGDTATIAMDQPYQRGRLFASTAVDSVNLPLGTPDARCPAHVLIAFPPDSLVRLDVSVRENGRAVPPSQYELQIWSGQIDERPQVCDLLATDSVAARDVLGVGDERSSELDSITGQAHFDVRLQGGIYTVDVTSPDFDPFIHLTGLGADSTDDDGGFGCNARLRFEAQPGAGPYRVLVQETFGNAIAGRFTVAVRSDSTQPIMDDDCSAPRYPTSTALLPSTIARRLTLDSLVQGVGDTLSRRDTLIDGTPAMRWRITTGSRDTVTVTLSLQSNDFDPYLWVIGDDFVLGDDDSGSECNAALRVPVVGSVDVIVNAYNPGRGGAFELSTPDSVSYSPCTPQLPLMTVRQQFRGADRLFRYDAVPVLAGRRLALDSAVRDSLTTGDFRLREDSTLAQAWRFVMDSTQAGQDLVFDLESLDFDAWLMVVGPDRFLEDDDGGVGRNARVRYPNAPAGTYQVVVNSWGLSGIGRFTLRVRPESPRRRQ